MPTSGAPPLVHKGNLLIISNRLPITIKKENDNYKYNVSSGGLVTGLSGLSKATRFQWFGWPGLEIPEEDVERVTRELHEKHDAVPVWISDELADKHCGNPSVKLRMVRHVKLTVGDYRQRKTMVSRVSFLSLIVQEFLLI